MVDEPDPRLGVLVDLELHPGPLECVRRQWHVLR